MKKIGRLAIAAIGCVLIAILPAAAQTAGTVTIGKEVKKTTGIVTALANGDVACYVTLKDDKGVEFTEMGDFSFCEKPAALIGKRVSLTYKPEKVLADECQGNPDCKKSKTVALITGVQVLGNAPAAKPAQAAPKQASFCTPMETVIFSCRTGAKMVSLCASKDASVTKGYLQYRFGKPDSAEPMDLNIPEAQPVPSKAATGENVPYSGGGASWLRFRNGEYGYVVYSGIGNWGPNGEKRILEGVAVEKGGKTIAVLPCSGKPLSELWPDFYEKVGITTHDQEFDLPIDWPVKK
jgi:hypothetical protein